MVDYEEVAFKELVLWKGKMNKRPSSTSSIFKDMQVKANNLIPLKVRNLITDMIRNMVKGVLTGSEYTTRKPLAKKSLENREGQVKERLDFYRKSAMVSGAGTGAGGFFLGLADFPILLSLKIKFLFDTASLYGFDVSDYKERLYILYVFQLAFSSKERGQEVFCQMVNWDSYVKQLPANIDEFDWETFEQQYRDYIDLAKMLQLVPGIGAAVGAYANYKLMDKLGTTAINAYRLRVFKRND
ncbi:MAG: EcsC family protein [Clostridiaceae bacterium]|nr:EcsC family protein [Clostridiaceae bacterium]